MRLRDIQDIVNNNLKKLSITSSNIKNQGHLLKIGNVQSALEALNELEKTGIFKAQFKKIESHEVFIYSNTDEISYQKEQANTLLNEIKVLKNQFQIFVNGISEILPNQNKFTFSIKLPALDKLNQFSDLFQELDKIFHQLLVNEYVDGKIDVLNFDTGSEWIDLITNSGPALSVIASVVYAAIFLKREAVKNAEMLEIVRNRKITNDMMENLNDQLSESLKKTLDSQAQEVMMKAGAPDTDKEYFERVKYCIKEISSLIDKGLQFFPSSVTPTEVKSVFPDFTRSNPGEMIPEMKEITENSDEN